MSGHRGGLCRVRDDGLSVEATRLAVGRRRDRRGALELRSRAEIIADGIVHGLGVGFGLVAATALIVLSGVFASTPQIVSASIYAAGLLTMLGVSAVYNLWPVSPRKWWLRRFDHSAIYVLIAATYTPFMMQMEDRVLALSLLGAVWGVAVIGIVLKLALPGRFDRLSIMLYLALGWSGLAAYDAVFTSLSQITLWFVLAAARSTAWRDLSYLAAAALPERDLARLRLAWRGVSLYGCAGPCPDLIVVLSGELSHGCRR